MSPPLQPALAGGNPSLRLDGAGARHVDPSSAFDAELAARFEGARPLAVLRGEASYYSDALAGRSTASGEPYDPQMPTAAHRTLPFGTVLRVARADGGPVVYVRVNDRGPFGHSARILDLSRAAAAKLDILRFGVVSVRAEVVHRPGR